ncbi:MAG: c-type cytochrome [Gammaproteobacteria bacterium]|jgi:cytochrome c5
MHICRQLLTVVMLLGIAGGAGAAADQAAAKQKPVLEGTQGYRDEIGRPPEPYKGPPRTGEQVYAYRCGACHAKTTQGAPMPGDDIEWGLRARQGMKVLMQHTINGYKQFLMPPRGGCGNCSDEELKAAVVYMLKVSGIEPPP